MAGIAGLNQLDAPITKNRQFLMFVRQIQNRKLIDFNFLQTESSFVNLDLCLNSQFHVCGLADRQINPIYDGGAARIAGSCKWLDGNTANATCKGIDVIFIFILIVIWQMECF